ncbi:MAG: glycine cleavage system aminomethyltransferase GcvT [Tissierellia bacterium]|nr:glycine cleavage system aminomethyltransferase GcvT [Tissierellia bacterium]
MKKTPLYQDHVDLGAEMVDFAGWLMPIRYTGLVEEHEAVRNQAGLFDVSHMGEIRIKGPQATEFIQHVFTNDVTQLEDKQIAYGFLLNHEGGVIEDLLTYKVDPNEYFMVVNAANHDIDMEWLLGQVGDFDVEVIDQMDDYGAMALQGPNAQEVLQKMVDFDLDEIKFFTFVENVSLAGVNAMISRTGYTGEDGFEIFVQPQDSSLVWNEILRVGQGIVKPAGLGSRDTLRFEAGLPLYGNELSDDRTPLESGFGFFVSQGDFIGSDVIKAERESGTARKIVAVELLDRGIARTDYPVYNLDQEEIGHITTGYKAPTVGKTIALALIPAEYAKLGEELLIGVRNKKLKAVQISKRFLPRKK